MYILCKLQCCCIKGNLLRTYYKEYKRFHPRHIGCLRIHYKRITMYSLNIMSDTEYSWFYYRQKILFNMSGKPAPHLLFDYKLNNEDDIHHKEHRYLFYIIKFTWRVRQIIGRISVIASKTNRARYTLITVRHGYITKITHMSCWVVRIIEIYAR